MSTERTFADGFIFKRNPKAPEFVIGNLSIKEQEAIAFIKKHSKNGWVNLSIKNGRSGNPYIELDTFTPTKQSEANHESENDAQDYSDGEVAQDQLEDQQADASPGVEDDLPF